MSIPASLPLIETLTADQADRVTVLAAAAEAVDGRPPLNEAALLRLRHPAVGVRHTVVTGDNGGAIAYGQLAPQGTDGAETVATIVVDPAHRRRGIGRQLLETLLGEAPHLRIWGRHGASGVATLTARVGLSAVRELMIMERSLAEPIEAVDPPPGVQIRPFRPAYDAESWLAANARAFANHPEQGALTRADLDARMAEPWFEAAGFFVAVRRGATGTEELIGFHWTKRHPDRLGEVYVLGVDPASGVRGLGRPLLARGLQHLQQAGDERVILYVEGDNSAARRLYDRAGFTVLRSDVQFQRLP